jgi:hypothetical protein
MPTTPVTVWPTKDDPKPLPDNTIVLVGKNDAHSKNGNAFFTYLP